MAVTIKSNLNLSARVDKITSEMKDILKEELIAIASEIDIRTASGKKVDGGSFASYRPSTIKQKQKANKQTSPVNLTNTGNMLGAWGKVTITETRKRITGIIGFTNSKSAEIAKQNQLGSSKRNRPARPWVGLSEKQRGRLYQRLGLQLSK